MEKYRQKTIRVEAVQFTGGAEQANQIIEWVYNNSDANARWAEAHPGWSSPDGTYGASPERILIFSDLSTVTAVVGQWIVLNEAEQFFVYENNIFHQRFVKESAE